MKCFANRQNLFLKAPNLPAIFFEGLARYRESKLFQTKREGKLAIFIRLMRITAQYFINHFPLARIARKRLFTGWSYFTYCNKLIVNIRVIFYTLWDNSQQLTVFKGWDVFFDVTVGLLLRQEGAVF